MTMLKTTALATATALLTATSALAGGMAEPIVTPIEIVEVDTESRSTSSGLLIPLIIIAALVALANDGSSSSDTVTNGI